jgi:hypothetical protein
MPKALIKDVIGPLPCRNSCYIVVESESRIIPISCNAYDAEICHSFINNKITLANGYEFLSGVLNKLDISTQSIEIDTVNDMIYGKIFLTTKLSKKPIKITTASPAAVINYALASELTVNLSPALIKKANDATIEYHRLKACMPLWPMPAIIDKTEMLHLLSDFVDKACSEYDNP